MKIFRTLLLCFLCFSGFSQTTPLTFTPIPTTSPEVISPNRGAEDWAGTRVVPIPSVGSPDSSVDVYNRFCWLQFQNYSTSAYTWSALDNAIHFAIDNGKRFNFRVFAMYPGQNAAPCGNVAGGFPISYPLAVHNAMQAEPVYKDAVDNSVYGIGSWCPNWNAPSFRTAWNIFQDSIIRHLKTNTYHGVVLYNAVGYVDIGTYGYTGEWTGLNATTNVNGAGTYVPANLIATSATQIQFISDFVTKWPDKQLSICIGAVIGNATFGGGVSDGAAPPDVGYYVFVTASNSIGKIGIRRDCLGQTNTFIPFLLENNSTVYNGLHFNTAIMTIYQVAPFNGEPCSCCTNPSSGGASPTPAGVPYFDLPRQATFYHLSGFGNGNFTFTGTAAQQLQSQDSVRQASKNTGYRMRPTGGSMTTTLISNAAFNISTTWTNTGVTPPYRRYVGQYQLRNGATVVWTGNSSLNVHLFQPGVTTNVSDNFTATGVPAGVYSLYFILNDTAVYNIPMRLQITGKGSDNAYLIRANITVQATPAPPVANAGTNQTITAPTSTVNLSGSASTGTITSYLWTMVSGPNTPTITTPANVTTSVTGLIPGTYIFRLSLNGGASTSTVQVTVNPAAPVANAGPNQTITAPTSTTLLNGSSSTGTITSILWLRISGPNTPTIATPTTITTNISGLIVGTYVFQLSLNGGASTSTVSVTVNPAVSANAGPNQTIQAPASSVILNGTASTGTITSRLWTRISGPNTPVIVSPTAATTNVTGLIPGTYVFRLTLNGGVSSSNTTITVLSISVGLHIFTTQTPSTVVHNDGQATETGIKFSSTVVGYITEVRFYKAVGQGGTHIGEIYSYPAGTRLAQVTFSGETASGWQTQALTTPLLIAANTTYIVSYFSSDGNYIVDNAFFNTSGVTNGFLSSPQGGLAPTSTNGVFKYTATPAYPNTSFNQPNYWSDVTFSAKTYPSSIPGIKKGQKRKIITVY